MLILVWFERSLHSAQVSEESCPWPLKTDDVTVGRKDLDPHGRFRGEWVNRSAILKEHDTVNSTANLSTWRHLTNQSMIPESGIMERRHQKHVSRLRRPFPLPRRPLGSLRSPIFFLFDPVFCLFPPLRSLVPGYYYKHGKSVLHEFFFFLLLKGDIHLVKSYNFHVIFVHGICRTNDNHLYGNQYIQYSA